MSEFTPPEGWVEAKHNEFDPWNGTWAKVVQEGKLLGYWVPQPPILPLPTEDGTSISVKWRAPRGYHMLTLSDNKWYPVGKGSEGMGWHFANALSDRITGWKLLAEPCENHYGREDLNRAEEKARKETAKKILDRYKDGCAEGYGRDAAVHAAIGEFL